jgi:hypothetical protein
MTEKKYWQSSLQRTIARLLLSLFAPLLLTTHAAAQSSESSPEQEKGMVFYEQFQGSSNTLGRIMKLDSRVGYNFNQHLGIDAGVPFYFVHASSASGNTSGNGLGNVYVVLRFAANSPAVSFVSSLTGTAPTGDSAAGLSTGRATFDWNNYVAHTFSRIMPFANVGVGNSIFDTQFFTRPFTTLGLAAHLEGGARLTLFRYLGVGASAYSILPSGQQKVYSKLVRGESGSVSARGHGVFESSHVSVGDPDIARDHGYSAWLDITPSPYVDLELGYNRSISYSLNTFSFGVGFNPRYLARKTRGH